MVDLSVNLAGVRLDNPVIPASGTFGFGEEFKDLYDLDILGAISFKGTTVAPRLGNPVPRIAECSSGLINSVGLPSPGIAAVIAARARWRDEFRDGPEKRCGGDPVCKAGQRASGVCQAQS